MSGFLHKIADFINGISTKPNIYSWRWKGQTSILTFLLLYAIYIVRIFSLLQILKKIYRSLGHRLKSYYSIDKESKRVNIPPIFVEIYFILCCAGAFVLSPEAPFSHYVAIYFLIETTVWVLYYHIFRRFYEERYAIMHPLEYLVTLPIIIVLQARCISILESDSFTNALISILNPNFASAPYICLLSILYVAIVFGIIITNLPLEKVKEKNSRNFYITIIGNGDVVRNRLIPAIKRYLGDKLFVVFDLQMAPHREHILGKKGGIIYKQIDNSRELEQDVLNSQILWIATPSYAHMNMLERWISKEVFIVIEKPLTALKSELKTLEHFMANDAWNKVFSLNYYYLEKALPLTYLFSPYSFYEKYLNFSDKSQSEILDIFADTGKILTVELTLFEQEDNRSWLNNDRNGGQYMETFIHLALLNKMIFGIETEFEDLSWKTDDYLEKRKTYIECHGKADTATFGLYMGKFMPQKKRCGKIEYENGTFELDFELAVCMYTHKTDCSQNFTLSVDQQQWGKYGIQLDMIRRCLKEGITPSSIDGSKLQLATLKWLFRNR